MVGLGVAQIDSTVVTDGDEWTTSGGPTPQLGEGTTFSLSAIIFLCFGATGEPWTVCFRFRAREGTGTIVGAFVNISGRGVGYSMSPFVDWSLACREGGKGDVIGALMGEIRFELEAK